MTPTLSIIYALLLCLSAVGAAQVVPGVKMAVAAPAQLKMFAPALSAIAPPTPATNLFYNIGLTWDSETNALITGYKIRYGTNTSAAFTNSVTTTNTFCTVSNLALKPTWYFQGFTLWGTNISEGSNIVQVQPPLEAVFVLSSVFPLYSSTDGVNWVTNKIVTLVRTNPPGNSFFRSHYRQLDYQWTNNQIRLKPFTVP